MSRTTIRIALLTLVVLLIAAFPALVQGAEPKAPTCKIYFIKIKGTVNGLAFERTGKLGIYTPGITDKNKQEIWLASGGPYTNPTKGAIRVTSNTHFAASSSKSASKLWMGYTGKYVSQNAPTRYEFFPNTDMATITNNLVNGYSMGTKAADIKAINYGELEVWVKAGGKVEGTIYLWDKFKAGKYNATFTGSLSTSNDNSPKCLFYNN